MNYHRYHIKTRKSPNIVPHPCRFNVQVSKLGLAKHLISEFFQTKGNLKLISSRPCVYGVFSGPVGGFAPREKLCVGCLRCTVQYPEMVTVRRNPDRLHLGDDYYLPDAVDTVVNEAESGRIPVKGAGYRGKFGGKGWDGMWTDMSEIVRPTRDGIHGREFISLEVDIGGKVPNVITYSQTSSSNVASTFPCKSVPIPILFDMPPELNQSNSNLCRSFCEAAEDLQTLSFLPFPVIRNLSLIGSHVIPIVSPNDLNRLEDMDFNPKMIELTSWNDDLLSKVSELFPCSQIILRTPFESDLVSYYHSGVRVFHLTCDYHGNREKQFVIDLIRNAHLALVKAGVRDEVTLIGSGGIILAEHVAKAIICGLDLVALDTPLLVALQAKFQGNNRTSKDSRFELPHNLSIEWGKQRLVNLSAAWCDQLLEILGAMGLREVRRLRGEMGRSMFQMDLEKEAFSGIKGYEQ